MNLCQETKERITFLAICFGLVFVLYGVSLFGDFVFDDRGIVEHAALLSNLGLLDKIVTLPYWTEAAGLYRPITLLSYTLNFVLFGLAPFSFHLVNLALYASIGFLLYLLVEKLFEKKLLAYAAAIIFLLLPIHSEVVANITGRSELLALFFSLVCFLELIKEKPKKYWLAGLWLFLAIGSKETAVATLPLAALIVYFSERGKSKETPYSVRSHLAHLAPAAVWLVLGSLTYFVLRFAVLGMYYFLHVETSLVENPLKFIALGPRIFTALHVLWLYVEKSFWPLHLCSDYSYNQLSIVHTFFNPYTLLGFAFFAWLMISLVIFLKRAPLIVLGSAFFLFSFLPVSNLLFPTGTIMGERLMLYPSVGLSLYAAYLISAFVIRLKNKKWLYRGGIGTSIAVVIFYSAIIFTRSLDWLTEKSLFASAATCAPNSALSLSNLGAEQYLEGNLADAKKSLLASRQIYDGYPKGINNLGLVYWKEGDLPQARKLFLEALNFPFPYYGAYENLALLALQEGKAQEARTWLIKFYSDDATTADMYLQKYQFTKPVY